MRPAQMLIAILRAYLGWIRDAVGLEVRDHSPP